MAMEIIKFIQFNDEAGYYSQTVIMFVGVVLKISFAVYKGRAVLIFIFQNIMIFKPFLFRENRHRLTICLGVCVMFQWLLTYCIFFVWAVVIVFYREGACWKGWKEQPLHWRQSLFFYSISTCALSFVFSSCYMFGFCREQWGSGSGAAPTRTKKQKNTIRQSVVCCSLEIVCDVTLVVFIATLFRSRNRKELLILNGFIGKGMADYKGIAGTNVCDSTVVLSYLQSGVYAYYALLLTQPLFQEVALLLFYMYSTYWHKDDR